VTLDNNLQINLTWPYLKICISFNLSILGFILLCVFLNVSEKWGCLGSHLRFSLPSMSNKLFVIGVSVFLDIHFMYLFQEKEFVIKEKTQPFSLDGTVDPFPLRARLILMTDIYLIVSDIVNDNVSLFLSYCKWNGTTSMHDRYLSYCKWNGSYIMCYYSFRYFEICLNEYVTEYIIT
jgi:hypothetical protein